MDKSYSELRAQDANNSNILKRFPKKCSMFIHIIRTALKKFQCKYSQLSV